MALEMRFKNGKLVNHFFGRMRTETGSTVFSLETQIKGEPPLRNGKPTLWGEGDSLFKASRAAAEVELKGRVEEAKRKGRADHIAERLVEIKTGKKLEYVKIADLAQRWRKLPREDGDTPGESWLKWCDLVFSRFAEATPKTFLHEVTQEDATEYLATLRRTYTRRTASGAASLLKSAFGRMLPIGMVNPFEASIKGKGSKAESGATIHRRPLTAIQLKKLFETAQPDPLLYPLTVCAACTGMRIGDICLLQWAAVDLKNWVVSVRTAKTGAFIKVPIFKPLRLEIESALSEKGESPYIWPGAANMYKKNRYGITYRGKALFARAFAKTGSEPVNVSKTGKAEGGKANLKKILPQVLEAVRVAGFAQGKQARIIDSLERVAKGQSYRSIEAETGRKHAIVSQDLKDAEDLTVYKFRKGKTIKSGRDIKTLLEATREKREGSSVLSASLLGWHSLRGTFVTLALSAGIPVETVKKITGHGIANTVLKYYYNPDIDHLREVLGDKLPEVLTGARDALPAAHTARLAEIAATLNGLTAEDRATVEAMADRKAVEA